MYTLLYLIRNRIPSCTFLFFLIFLFFSIGYGEEVGKFTYTDTPELLDSTTLVLSEKIVAMSESVHVDMFTDSASERAKNSIIFVIDNSGSMNGSGGIGKANDKEGSRFRVTSDLLDTIYNISPKIQVGLSIFGGHLFFDPNDDQIFRTCPAYDTGSFIPLLQLDSTYNGKTGYEILKHYLKTKTVGTAPSNYVDLEYTPSNVNLNYRSTNISAGFEAAKEGMKESKFEPENRFLIFLSDGDATSPAGDDNFKNLFKKGIDVPTTFTVFFTSDTVIPPSLDTMNQNIKTNGYSTSNPLSNLWSIKTDYDKLMKLLMENVIGKMIQKTHFLTPDSLTINTIGPIVGWNKTLFTMPKLFELKGKFTDFDYKIDYKLHQQSIIFNPITNKFDTTLVFVKDLIHTITYDVEIRDGSPTPPNVDIALWGRNLEFYYNNSKISLIDETMDSLEIRFSEYLVDMVYGYKNVKIDMTNQEGGTPDVETFTLVDEGNYYSHKFKRIVANPIAGDGILQHQSPDYVTAIFRNPELMLDTLRHTIRYQLSTVVEVHQGIYFDNDADGYIDSIYIGIHGKKIAGNIDEIISKIEFPDYRNFTILSSHLSGEGIGLRVQEDKTNYIPRTYVTVDDKLIIKDSTILAQGGLLVPVSVSIIDSIAPVINKASLLDSLKISGRDELTIEFSEAVLPITNNIPFKFYSLANNKVYEAELSVINQNNNKGIFEVKSLIGVNAIQDKDSIRINWLLGLNVFDALQNNQDNPKNVRREIEVTVVKALLSISKGTYFDNNANGFVDSIFLAVNGEDEDIQKNANDFLAAITLPKFRKFNTSNSKIYALSGGISFTVEENADYPTTFCTKEDVLDIAYTVLPQGGVIDAGQAPIDDSVAPVIHWGPESAYLIDYQDSSITDTLRVTFSEPIEKVSEKRPFHFIDVNSYSGQYYQATMSPIGHSNDVMFFKIESISPNTVLYMQTGDSIWINDTNCIKDEVNNYQNNFNNIKRILVVKRNLLHIDLIPNTTTPFKVKKEGTLVINKEVINSLDPVNKKELEQSKDLKTNKFKGIIITITPVNPEILLPDYTLKGRISIFDPVGNTMLYDRKMGFNSKTKTLIFFWNGKNKQNRYVGASSYLARMECKETTPSLFKNGDGPDYIKKVLIGVSE